MKLDKDISLVKQSFEAQSFNAPSNVWNEISNELDNAALNNKVSEGFLAQSFQAPDDLWNSISNDLNNLSIDAKVKEGFEAQTHTAPAFDFNELSNVEGVDNLVNQSFEQTVVAAPDTIWEKVQNGLDTENVWSRIAATEIKVGSNKWQAILVAASLALLMTLIPTNLNEGLVDNRSTSQIENKSEIVPFGIVANEETISNNLYANNLEDVVVIESPIYNDNTASDIQTLEDNNGVGLTGLNDLSNGVNNTVASNEENTNLELLPKTTISGLGSPLVQEAEFATLEVKRDIRKWSFNAGLIGGLHNSWILDNDTRASFDKETLLDSKMALGNKYGFNFEAWYKDKNSLSVNMFVNSSSRNRLGFYDNGIYKIRTSQIDFFEVSLLYGRKFNFKGATRDHNLIFRGGPYLGVNKRSFVKEDNTIVSYNDAFKKLDYGLTVQLGQEYDVNNFVIGYGLNSEIGLRNIFSGNGSIDPSNNYTTKFDIGAYLSVGYRF
ncbi:PorT family protein [Paracrocinitomix mangrovi]|uniref:PorT family protein n=1 Tax=Paracrocinitomix mangrovi TaxID=2862509 RepID=UPI001C8D45D9|nr:PorT family protein [Paracrocinitomix mangrovi]UKN00117.1 PorT family protein [Paracrocinitomix mangrovi]